MSKPSDDNAALIAQLLKEGSSTPMLLDALVSGRPEPWVAFLQEYGPKVGGFLKAAFSQKLDDAEIEDVLGDALVKAMSAIRDYKPDRGSLRTWFTTIARNTAIDALRKRRVELLPQIAGVIADPASDENQSDQATRHKDALALRKIIHRLTKITLRITNQNHTNPISLF